MEDLRDLTLEQLLARLRAEVTQERAKQQQARQAAERAEAAIRALEALVRDDEPASKGQAVLEMEAVLPAPNGSLDRPLGEDAVLRVVAEEPNRVWSPAEIHAVIEARTWRNPDAEQPRAGTDAAISRLVKKRKLEKLGRARYRHIGGAIED